MIGLDIGGTKIEGVVFDGRRAVKSLTIVTPRNLSDFKYSLTELLKFLSLGIHIGAVGVGTAGVVDSDKGVVLASPNLEFLKNFKFAAYIKSLGYQNVKIDNDANCFARAEMLLGQGKKYKNVVGVILGTGIGSGLYLNGQNYRGSHHGGGEIGQLIMCNDTLEHHYQKAKDKGNFSEVGRLLSVRFVDLAKIFDPDCFILGGTVSKLHYKKFSTQIARAFSKYLNNRKFKSKILISHLNSAGALGAALLFNQ